MSCIKINTASEALFLHTKLPLSSASPKRSQDEQMLCQNSSHEQPLKILFLVTKNALIPPQTIYKWRQTAQCHYLLISEQ